MANAKTEKATLLGQNSHEFQVVITVPPFAEIRRLASQYLRLCAARSVQKAPHCMIVSTLGVFPSLQTCIEPHRLAWVLRQE